MRFAAIGLDHRHVYDLVQGLIDAGCSCAGHTEETTDHRVLEGFRRRFPGVPARSQAALLEDPSIAVVVLCAVPRDRAALAIAAMRHGKDVLCDKPGVVAAAEVDALERTVAETGRIYTICFGERFLKPSAAMALRLVRDGAIGRVVQTVGLGPHRLNRALRPGWFFDRACYGGILNDIGTHQVDQFLAFADAEDATVESSTVGCFGTGPDFEDFGEMLLSTDRVRGYARVDWFTPDGLPTWGDGRLTVIGTAGMIEIRKNVDLAGAAGGDHLFLVDATATRRVDCAGEPVVFFRSFVADVARRTHTLMPQRRAFTVSRLALHAQATARRFVAAA